ncbi:MAG: ABC transporter substrate-binding protein [Phycisphaerales bacterium]|nr:ABC transporter substrate-binding protein [Phycisphaerales bacterium]
MKHGPRRMASRAALTRREAVGVLVSASVGAWASGCSGGASGSASSGEVVLYSSVDDFLLQQVIRAFEASSGIHVRALGDTEATKTTGLVERLIAERERPRADVWWASEPFGTIRLAAMGLFEPVKLELRPPVEERFAPMLRGRDGLWHGIAFRARVIGVREGRFDEGSTPRRVADLAEPRLKGRIGMARPRFGTTRGHMAALAQAWGMESFREWLLALRSNGVRLYGGNSSVVRAIADGEIDVGLTDSDDVWGARRNSWPVVAVFEAVDHDGDSPWPSFGPMLLPNTVARVKGGPNGAQAGALIQFLLEGPAEEMLALSDSHNLPARHGPFAEVEAEFSVPGGWAPDLAGVSAVEEAAMAACDEVLGA